MTFCNVIYQHQVNISFLLQQVAQKVTPSFFVYVRFQIAQMHYARSGINFTVCKGPLKNYAILSGGGHQKIT